MQLNLKAKDLPQALYNAFRDWVKETNPHPGLQNWKRLPPTGRLQWERMAIYLLAEHTASEEQTALGGSPVTEEGA